MTTPTEPNPYWPPRAASPDPTQSQVGAGAPQLPDPPPWNSTPPAAPRKRWVPWVIAAAVLLALGIVAGILISGGVLSGGGLSQDVAQRECRTALEAEAKKRANNLGAETIVATVKRVELAETFQTDAGYTVNGTVAYTLTSGLLPQVEQSVSLTCEAAGTDDAVTTAVKNRG